MKTAGISFLQMLRRMRGDAMLVALASMPFLTGGLFRFVIPAAEDRMTGYFGINQILRPYYGLFDLFMIILTPSMFNYAVAMVMLEERDDHIAEYLSVTPLGRGGYLFSRLGLTALISFPAGIITAMIFHLSQTDTRVIAGIALAGSAQGVMAALLIVALSANKVEGMAVGKFASLLSLGALAPYFMTGKTQFLISVFPSFWIGRAMRTGGYCSLLVSILLALLWTVCLSGRFMRKMAG